MSVFVCEWVHVYLWEYFVSINIFFKHWIFMPFRRCLDWGLFIFSSDAWFALMHCASCILYVSPDFLQIHFRLHQTIFLTMLFQAVHSLPFVVYAHVELWIWSCGWFHPWWTQISWSWNSVGCWREWFFLFYFIFFLRMLLTVLRPYSHISPNRIMSYI